MLRARLRLRFLRARLLGVRFGARFALCFHCDLLAMTCGSSCAGTIGTSALL